MNSNRSRLACIAIVVATIAVFGLLRVPFLSLPLERDEGEYAYIAQRAAYGEIPYRDAFDQKPPGVFAAYRLAFSLFGETIEGIHLFLYLWTAATTMVLFAFVRRTAGELAASFSALAFKGKPVLADPNCASGLWYMLRPGEDGIVFKALEGADFDFNEFKPSSNQTVMVRPLRLTAGLCLKNRRYGNNKLTSITD